MYRANLHMYPDSRSRNHNSEKTLNKFIRLIGLIGVLMIPNASILAQQTLEEATDSIKNILNLAKKGDSKAQNEVGNWYYRGRHVKQSYEEALQWWAKSAKQGNIQAIGNMGLCYQTGHGIEADSIKAVQLYQRSIKDGNKALLQQNINLAEKGNIFSNMLIASCYQNGYGVPKDIDKTISYLTTAADKNCVPAQFKLALILLNNKKPESAASWFKKGADNEDLGCTFYYGKMLLEGLGMKQDKQSGANYLLKAAEGGFPQAMYYVGNCYLKGIGLTKNTEQGVKWLRKAAGKDVVNAQWSLAQSYREGNGTDINYNQALYWYAQAYANGFNRSFKNLITDSIPNSPFVNYLSGIKAYTNKEYEDALREFKTVEKAGITDGKIMTAAILVNSNYAKHNIKKGVKLLDEAAKTSPLAIYLLGGLYEAGKGVDKNMNQAVEYMQKAADMGYAAAECALADMYYEGRGVEQNYTKAVVWYEKAANQGQLTENAAKRFASCYENGWGGLDKNPQKATSLLNGSYKNHINELLNTI